MDALTGLLEGPRARGAFMIRACFDPPWCVRVADRAPLTIMLMVRGDAWIVPGGDGDGGGERVRLRAGDLAIARGPDPYLCADDPATPPQAVILPGAECAYPDGRPLNGSMDLGVRSWGDRLDGSAVMLIGTYLWRGEIGGRLLDALPPLLSLTSEEWECPLTPILMAEVVRDEPGQEVVLDRLLDLLVIAALRAWFATREAPAWYRAMADPVVGRVLRLLHDDPAHPWTVAALAAKALCPGRRSPGASTTWSGSPRWPTSPRGGSPWPRTASGTPTTPWRRSPGGSATEARSPCRARSRGSTG
jgi:hypothetical protein